MIKVRRNTKESNDRIIQKFNNKVKLARLPQQVKDKRYFARPKSKRKIRDAAIMKAYYRNLREKMKFYS